MDVNDLIAIDTHTHAEVSCWNPFDNYGEEYDRAADKYFRSSRRPTIAETVAYYRERKLGLVMFTVDAEAQMGRRRIPNEEIAEAARNNADIMIAFASIDPHKGRMGAREARRLIEEAGGQGLQVPPHGAGLLARRPHGLAALRSGRRVQAAGDLPQRPLGHRLGHALRRRLAPAAQQPDAARRRGNRLSRHPDRRRPPELALAGRGALAGAAQAQCVDRPVGLEPEVLSAATGAVRQHAAEGPHAVRLATTR